VAVATDIASRNPDIRRVLVARGRRYLGVFARGLIPEMVLVLTPGDRTIAQ
jgi:hypothetical protein